MRIVQVINSLETGGAERLAIQLHERYLERGHDASLVALAGDLPRNLPCSWSAGLLNPYCPMAPAALDDLPPEVGLRHAELIHVHLFPSQAMVPLSVTSSGTRLVTTEHSTANRRRGRRWARLLDGLVYSRYSRIACVSPAAAEALGDWVPRVNDRIRVVPNGIDLNLIGGIRDDRPATPFPVLLSIGRLSPAKNYHVALETIALLLRGGRRLTYIVAGDGPLRRELERASCDLGVNGSVRFLGNVADVTGLLSRADLFFMPSRREGFGLAAVEAMASGLPVVASDVPGIGDILGRDGSCGLLSPPDSPEGFARNIEMLLDDPDLRKDMGVAASSRAGIYDIESTADGYLRLYLEALEEGHRL